MKKQIVFFEYQQMDGLINIYSLQSWLSCQACCKNYVSAFPQNYITS